MPRRSTPRFLVVPAAILLAACGGSSGAASADETAEEHASASPARAPSLPVVAKADLEPAATVDEPAFNGFWGVDAAESINADNNLGGSSNGACSGRGVAQGDDCGSSMTSLKSLQMPSLFVSSPSGSAAATASASSKAMLGLLTASLAVSAQYSSPDASGATAS